MTGFGVLVERQKYYVQLGKTSNLCLILRWIAQMSIEILIPTNEASWQSNRMILLWRVYLFVGSMNLFLCISIPNSIRSLCSNTSKIFNELISLLWFYTNYFRSCYLHNNLLPHQQLADHAPVRQYDRYSDTAELIIVTLLVLDVENLIWKKYFILSNLKSITDSDKCY